MQNFYQRLRTTYTGEEINATATYENGSWTYDTETIEPTILDNDRTGKQAVVLGNGASRNDFDINYIFKQPKLQTYGCNAIHRDAHYDVDFLVINNDKIAQELVVSGGASRKIVYANSDQIFEHPGVFYLMPQDPQWNAGAMAAYMAAFDGHKQVYLVGFDGQDTHGNNNNVYTGTNAYQIEDTVVTDDFYGLALKTLMQAYPLVEFVHVNQTGKGNIPSAWKECPNFRRISFHQLVLECDL
jgi:hypothetical protein|tara:strand:- start:655 stop:1380 length:726 start_codon:yes stop_codon:yes gene_type:complete